MDNSPFLQQVRWNPTRTGFLDPVTGATVSYSKNAMAKAYLSSSGQIALASSKGVATAIGANGNLYCVTNAGLPMVFNGATKAWTTYGVIPTPPAGSFGSGARSMFMDSRGYIFMALGSKGCIYRSTDGGQTYANVHSFTYTDEDCMGFAEDNLGNLYAHAYGHATPSVQLLKSTDSGATWTEISATAHVFVGATDAGTVASKVSRHIHLVHWCKHRNLLFVSHGDSGSYSPILVSDDHGASFHAWGSFTTKNNTSATRQATAIVTDETAIYYVSDVGLSVGDYDADTGSIYRVQAAPSLSLSALLALAPVKVHSNNPLDGWSSNSGVTSEGYIWFTSNSALNYSGKLVASVDKGNTWEEVYVTPAATGGGYGAFAPSRASISDYFTGPRDDLKYGNTNTFDICGFRVVPYTAQITAYNDLVTQWASGPNHTNKLYVDFETLPTPNAVSTPTGGSYDLASTTRAFAGTKSGKFVFAGAGGVGMASFNNLLNGYAMGTELIVDARFYIEQASFPGNVSSFIDFVGPDVISIGCNMAGQVIASKCCSASSWSAVASLDAPVVPLNQWFRLRVIVKKHDTAGEVTVFLNNVMALRVVGVPTLQNSASDLFSINVGMNPNGNPTGNLYVDTLVTEVLLNPPVRNEASIVI